MYKIQNFSRVDETEYSLPTDNINLLYYDLPKHFSDDYRSYDSPRLCTIIEGVKEVSINQSERFVYNCNDFVLLPPHSNVYMSMTEYTKALVYEFSDCLIDKVSQKVSEHLQITVAKDIEYSTFLRERIPDRLGTLHRRIQEIIVEEDANIHFLLDLTCQEIIYELMKIKGCYDIIYHHQNHPINQAIRMMNSPDGHAMTISHIAEEVHMSLSGFSQKFKLITDQSPKDYLTRLRLKKSKQHLRNLSVTDTAYEVGFENISHYIRLFRKEYGVTPKQYQLGKSVR
ncbi:HTH-type transcriptional activator RhaS [Vibrio aerogenes CECT 7868]|uniref:HTH-type transcriptional activator RhaS n=1 Tax=Vibrio aerogenes CECT 7868 TaxID=1216006 RepID=A0A1M5ZNV0_9VIBR|nr:response regulator transcription factor [Vibrio aerogenes]SHI25799.1 HTH-type transcriptional activator RhaS [Vibrio aerogenes CECT 7868]